MLLNVTPLHDGSHCCLEDTFLTLSHWWGRSYLLMYAKAWDFGFKPLSASNTDVLGYRVIAGVEHCWESFEQYHGFRTEWHYKETASEQIEIMKQELASNTPVMVCIDAYWLPWARTYQIQHAKHYFLAIGWDPEDQSIKCLDPFIIKEMGSLPKDHFEQGNARCIKLSIVGGDAENVDWHQLVESAAELVLTPKDYGRNSFADMRVFADEVEERLDLTAEAKLSQIPFLVPLFFRMRYVGVGRNKFGKVLNYLGERFDQPELLEMAEIIKGFGKGWMDLRKLYMETVVLPSQEEQRKIVVESAGVIRKLAVDEEQFATGLVDLSHKLHQKIG